MSHTAVFTLFGIHSTKYVLENKQHSKHLVENIKFKVDKLSRYLKGATSVKSELSAFTQTQNAPVVSVVL